MFIYGNKKFNNSIKKIVAFNNAEFYRALDLIQELQEKYYLAGYISYQAKDIFLNKKIQTKNPLLYFEAFENFENFDIKAQNKNPSLYIKENISFEEYKKNFDKIISYIKQGATYEVNYTYSNDVFSTQSGYELFLSLIKNQKTPYCAYIDNEFSEILSFSPELFFEVENNKIITKPMKGTIKRQGDDKKEIDFLKNDVKNLAENTMIVDLLRNDLSKIETSSNINVEKLFEVETHKTLHQMTSTISAQLNEFNFKNILEAIFPCGSITGAPKISTMKIIDEIENYKRNIYCGAIGFIHKNNCNFSVPIRILEKRKKSKYFKFCQGGAIVIKSDVKDEFEECKTKKLFLGNSLDFNLIETILIKNNKPQLYFEHLKRLKNSCETFGYKFNNNLLNEKFENDKIARIVLDKYGNYEIQYREIKPLTTRKIILTNKKLNSSNFFLYHKTSYRPWFDESYKQIQNNEIFDTIFLNEKNELTEGSRTNIILKIKGKLYTPKLSSGLLDGIYRQQLIKQNLIKERILYEKDLYKAQKIYLINSIRGIVEVEL